MLSGKRFILSGLLVTILFPDFSSAENSSREMLLYEKIPIVSISAKHPQKISDSPSTTYLITEEDIRSSGATNIPDILRMVPGIEVMATSASDFNVSARGNNQLLANKMLVLIDGRFVYQDLFGMVFWETLTVQLEDIKQIEIILGPGSALYGANAFSGVINIITKDPYEDPGTSLWVRRGDPGLMQNSITHRGRLGNFSYKISASDNKLDKWEETDISAKGFSAKLDDSEDIHKFWGLLQYNTGRDSTFSVSGGKSCGTVEFFPIEYMTVLPWESEIYWYRIMYKTPNLMVHFFENSGRHAIVESTDDDLSYRTREGEITYTLNAGENNILTVGGTTRNNMINFEGQDESFYLNPWGIYLQDELKLSDKLTLVGGARYDYHPLAGYQTSPRGSFVYHVSEENTVRFSAGKAYRNPSFFENYLDWEETVADLTQGPAQPGQLNRIEFILLGNRNLKPEEIVSYEIGYQGNLPGQTYGISLFYNDITNIISHRYITGNIMDVGESGDINLLITKQFQNTYSAYSYGGEAYIENRLTRTLSTKVGYSHLEMFNKDTNERIETSPIHNVTGEIRYKSTDGLTINFQGQYHGKTVWDVEGFSIDPNTLNITSTDERFEVPAYTVFNLNVAKKFGENIELSLAGNNIFNDAHREFPEISMPVDSSNPFGELAAIADSRPNTIGRRLTASLRIDF